MEELGAVFASGMMPPRAVDSIRIRGLVPGGTAGRGGVCGTTGGGVSFGARSARWRRSSAVWGQAAVLRERRPAARRLRAVPVEMCCRLWRAVRLARAQIARVFPPAVRPRVYGPPAAGAAALAALRQALCPRPWVARALRLRRSDGRRFPWLRGDGRRRRPWRFRVAGGFNSRGNSGGGSCGGAGMPATCPGFVVSGRPNSRHKTTPSALMPSSTPSTPRMTPVPKPPPSRRSETVAVRTGVCALRAETPAPPHSRS